MMKLLCLFMHLLCMFFKCSSNNLSSFLYTKQTFILLIMKNNLDQTAASGLHNRLIFRTFFAVTLKMLVFRRFSVSCLSA